MTKPTAWRLRRTIHVLFGYTVLVSAIAHAQSSREYNRLPASGPVGIGTRQPARPLHIVSEQGGEVLLEGSNGLPDFKRWSLYVDGPEGAPKALFLRILNDGGTASSLNAEVWTSSGYTGLGNMNPLWQLSITGNGQRGAALTHTEAGGGAILINASDQGVGSGGAILFGVNAGTYGQNGFFSAIKALHNNGSLLQTGDLAVSLRATAEDQALTERLRLTQSGNLGIGISEPIEKLHVNGNAAITNGGVLHLSQGHVDGHWGVRLSAIDSGATGEDLVMLTRNTPTGPFHSALTIRANGMVGIGTGQPAHELTVNGVIQAEDIVLGGGIASRVLLDNYPLLSLDELDQYIRTQGELPNTTRTASYKLSDNNRVLQQKIEELTLYVIALHKRIEALEAKSEKPATTK